MTTNNAKLIPPRLSVVRRRFSAFSTAEAAADCLICLINQASYLPDRQGF